MGNNNCCLPSKQGQYLDSEPKFVKPKEIIISTPTSNPSKNQSPKNAIVTTDANNFNGVNKSTKVENLNPNEDEEEDIENVSQIFIRNDNENFDSEAIKSQSKIKLEDFKLLKV